MVCFLLEGSTGGDRIMDGGSDDEDAADAAAGAAGAADATAAGWDNEPGMTTEFCAVLAWWRAR